MANKLKGLFSKKPTPLSITMSFDTPESRQNCLEVLAEVREKGGVMPVEGVTSIETTIKDGTKSYPIDEKAHPVQVMVGIPPEIINLPIETECGRKTIELQKFRTNKAIILKTLPGSVVSLSLEFLSEKNVSLSTTAQIEKAKTVNEVAECYDILIGILKCFIKPADLIVPLEAQEEVTRIKRTFRTRYLFWKKLSALEEEFRTTFKPSDIQNAEDDFLKIEELYLMLIEHKVIRQNRKVTSLDSVRPTCNAEFELPQIGQELGLSFSGKAVYQIGKHSLEVYTANFVLRAKVKVIVEDGDKIKTIFYDDTDSEPMYITSTGYHTAKEADKENEAILNDSKLIERYRNAVLPTETLNAEIDMW